MLTLEEMVTLTCRCARLASIALEKHDVYMKGKLTIYNDRRVYTYEDVSTSNKILIRSYLSGEIEYEATLKGTEYKGALFG